MGVVHAHSWLVGSFRHEAQAESYGANPDAIVCAVVAPRGKASGRGRLPTQRALAVRVGRARSANDLSGRHKAIGGSAADAANSSTNAVPTY
jgi:hypothetical protein